MVRRGKNGYHVKPDGEIGACNAIDGSCPYAVFDDLSKAESYSERTLAEVHSNTGLGRSLKKSSVGKSSINGSSLWNSDSSSSDHTYEFNAYMIARIDPVTDVSSGPALAMIAKLNDFEVERFDILNHPGREAYVLRKNGTTAEIGRDLRNLQRDYNYDRSRVSMKTDKESQWYSM